MTERATSSSAVSRRFVALSTKRLEAFLDRPSGELDLRVVCIDGKVFRDHCMVIALEVDAAGRKHVLGLREGATETAAVNTGVLSDLVTRGLPTDRTLLFVLDGAPGLHRAITDVFGARGVLQRCQVHKCRNVLGHLSRATARIRRQGVAGCVGPGFGGPRGAGAEAAGRLAAARPPRRGGVHPRGTRRDADRAAPRPAEGAATYAAHDEYHREPERQRRALYAERQVMGWTPPPERHRNVPRWSCQNATSGSRAPDRHWC